MSSSLPTPAGEALFERLETLAARCAAHIATDEEKAEWAELSVAAIEATRVAKSADAHRLATSYFAHLATEFGDEVAREAWKAAPPKRRRGYHTSDEKRRRDALIMVTDKTYKCLGVGSEEAAARALGNGMDQHDARRVIDRKKAKSRHAFNGVGETPIRK